jgi:5-methylcytosine-specific restriction endonuclease McrA
MTPTDSTTAKLGVLPVPKPERQPKGKTKGLRTRGPQQERKGRMIRCEVCGAEFYASPARLKEGRRFCSRDCWRVGMTSPSTRTDVRDKISRAKTKHGLSSGKRQRQLEHAGCTLKAKGETCCRNCGGSRYLHLHHAIPRSMWKAGILEPLNCIPLCVSCHHVWHGGRGKGGTLPRRIFKPDEWACISTAPLLGQDVMAFLDRRYPA